MKIKNNRGISLVELLVAAAILAIVMPMIASILINGIQDYVSGTNYVAQQDSINGFYQTIRSDFERSSSVSIELPENTVVGVCKSITMRYTHINKATNNVDDIIAKKWYFVDKEGPEDELRLINFESGTPIDVEVLKNVLVTDNTGKFAPIGKVMSCIRKISNGKIFMEVWFNDINTQFFKGRNYGTPFIFRFDTSNKTLIELH